MTTQRITGSIPVLCLIALASFFTLTFSAIPEEPEVYEDSDSGYGIAPNVSGSVWVGGYTLSQSRVSSQHSVNFYNYSDDAVFASYAMKLQVRQKPVLTATHTNGRNVDPMDGDKIELGGWLSVNVSGLREGRYNIDAYTSLNAGNMGIRAEAMRRLNKK